MFVTKKKAISSIQNDYNKLKPDFDITIINYESLHKVEGKFECIVLDESHCMGAYKGQTRGLWKKCNVYGKKQVSKICPFCLTIVISASIRTQTNSMIILFNINI